MHPLKAQVKNGRMVLDEPTDLPDGVVPHLVPAHPRDEQRAVLHESPRESAEELMRGSLIVADDALAELRAHR